MSLIQDLDDHGVWRKPFALRLKRMSEWLGDHGLREVGVHERLEQLHSQALQKVAEVRRVSRAEAATLGVWNEEIPDDNPPVAVDGCVEVPRWRHALINMAHSLLKQGQVILGPPGLDAIGAEPEFTVNLLPQAHAVVLVVGVDTGVTKSALAIWRQHITGLGKGQAAHLVVINRIDTMWDALSTPEQVQQPIASQRADSIELLGLSSPQMIAVAAQKGLLAKVSENKDLLQASNLLALERALGGDMLGAAVALGMNELGQEAGCLLHTRERDLVEQVQELEGLRGKNVGVIEQMRARIEQEQAEFDASGATLLAVQTVHMRLLQDLFALLGTGCLKYRGTERAEALKRPDQGGRLPCLRRHLQEPADRSRSCRPHRAGVSSHARRRLQKLNAGYGFSLRSPSTPQLGACLQDLKQIEKRHMQHLSLGNTLRLAHPEFAERLARALMSRLRVVYDTALNGVDGWNRSAFAQLDARLRERCRNFMRRTEAVWRIPQAAGGLDERIAELRSLQAQLPRIDATLNELAFQWLAAPANTEPEAALA